MKTSLWFFPNTQKKSAKTGKVPLYVRVILNGKKSEGRIYPTELSEKEGMLWNDRAMRLNDLKHKANKLINAVQLEFDKFIILNCKNINRYSASSIRDHLLGRNKEEIPTALAYLENYYVSSVEKSNSLSTGTKKNYKKAIRHFATFLEWKKKTNLLLTNLTSTVANEFKDYLLCASDDGSKRGMTEPSAAGNIMKFKTMFKRAVEDELLEKNPFKGVNLKTRSPRKPRLTVAQVKAIYELNLTKYPGLFPTATCSCFPVSQGWPMKMPITSTTMTY